MITLSIDPKAPAPTQDGLKNGAYAVARDERRIMATRNLTEAVLTCLSLAHIAKSKIRVVPVEGVVAGLSLSAPFLKAGAPLDPAELLPEDFKALYLSPPIEDADRNGIPDATEEIFQRIVSRIKRRGTLRQSDAAELSAAGVPAFSFLRAALPLGAADLHNLDPHEIGAGEAIAALTAGYNRFFGIANEAPTENAVGSTTMPDDGLRHDGSEVAAVGANGNGEIEDQAPAPLDNTPPLAGDALYFPDEDETPQPRDASGAIIPPPPTPTGGTKGTVPASAKPKPSK